MTGPIEQRVARLARGEQTEQFAFPGDVRQDHTPPLSLGYLQSDLLTADELTETKERLKKRAFVEGLAIGAIYVEQAATTPAAFEALIDAINRYEVKAVVIPSLLHFVELAVTNNIKDTFERATGARVLVANSYP